MGLLFQLIGLLAIMAGAACCVIDPDYALAAILICFGILSFGLSSVFDAIKRIERRLPAQR